MAYEHFEDVSEVIVSTELATQTEQLVTFLVSATLQQQTIQHHLQTQRARSQSWDEAHNGASASAGAINMTSLSSSALTTATVSAERASLLLAVREEDRNNTYGAAPNSTGNEDVALTCETGLPCELSASLAALRVITKAQRLLHDHIEALRLKWSSFHQFVYLFAYYF